MKDQKFDYSLLKKKGFRDYWILNGRETTYRWRNELGEFAVFDEVKRFWKIYNVTKKSPLVKRILGMGLKIQECENQS